ncbi:MAG: low molecular weight phosphotyrosine protein phosphatase [Jiangellaceae bacterium]|nr:low molecular weight phosphotyrosine protein phosphatase [Jiangellaceae bacterium]
MAAVVLRARLAEAGLADRVSVESAGLGSWHVGGPADRRALSALQSRGLAAEDHRARQFGADSFDQYDVVLAMDREILADLHRLAPNAARRDAIQMLRAYDPVALASGELDVADPYFGDDAGFTRALAQIEAAVDGLVSVLEQDLGTVLE